MPINYTGNDNFDDNIRLKAETDKVLGGLANPANVGAEDLADRTIYLKEQNFRDLKDQIEMESGGMATARKDDHDIVDYFHVLRKYYPAQLIDGGSHMGDYGSLYTPTRSYHPAFYVNGVLKDEILISMLMNRVKTIISVDYFEPSVDSLPDGYDNMTQMRLACTQKGTGYHLMNQYEWAALTIKSLLQVDHLDGNNNYGYSVSGSKYNRLMGKIDITTGKTFPGSGPLQWKHNHQLHGVADLVGNLMELVDGIYIDNGQIFTYSTRDNNYGESEGSWTATGLFFAFATFLQIHTSVIGTVPFQALFENMINSVTMWTAGNILVDTDWISDMLICPENYNGGSVKLMDFVSGLTGDVIIDSVTTKRYCTRGGAYDGGSPTSPTRVAGLGAMSTQADALSEFYGRVCLIE